MVNTLMFVTLLKLIQKSLLDVHDGKGALLKLAGAAGAVCPMTSSCQSIEDKPSGSFLIIQLCDLDQELKTCL